MLVNLQLCASDRLDFDVVGMDLSAVIMWVGLELSAVVPRALYFLCTCQLDLLRVSGFKSIERFMTLDTIQQLVSPGTSLI
jgi:hypothetical protein